MIKKWREIEKKWQKRWVTEEFYKAYNPGDPQFNPQKPSYYVLDMFPYPSGSGLHVGHTLGYIGTDIIARKKWMEGFSVLHPMGWDAFGLPAEQYAIQTGQHPRITTDQNTANYRRQLQNLGMAYDWSREIDTSNPKYFRWTQWLFLKMYQKGLVYRKEMPVWWCEELKTVLANEEVINGYSERGNYPCERKLLTQWVLRITDYAERLLQDLDELDWPESIKKMQRDWIGRSVGAQVRFPIDNQEETIEVFTTRVDTLFGVVALVLAPEHPLVDRLTHPDLKEKVFAYKHKSLMKSERNRKAEAGQGHMSGCFIGHYVLHPLTSEKLPIYIADYVLGDYGTGAVMSVPSHDERDFQFAKTVGLPLRPVIKPINSEMIEHGCFTEDGILINSYQFTDQSSSIARTEITKELEKRQLGFEKIFYKMRDWIFSRQRYWGEPFPLFLDENNQVVLASEDELPITLPDIENFEPNPDGSSPLARVIDWVEVTDRNGRKLKRVTDTMPGWAGSCWYYLRFMDPQCDTAPFSEKAIEYWKQVDLYVGGASHAVMHLLYARFWHKVLYDLGLVKTKEPFKKLFNQGMITAYAFRDQMGRLVPSDQVILVNHQWVHQKDHTVLERFVSKMAKSLKNVVNPDDVIEQNGCDTFRLYEMFMGPLADEKPWDQEGLSGCEHFLKRWWNFLVTENNQISCQETSDLRNWKALHKALKRTNDSFVHFNFNIAIAAFMEALNDIKKNGVKLSRPQIEMWVKMMHPFAPHLTSEIWELLGYRSWLHLEPWPTLDESFLIENTFELVLQINGKIKKRELVSTDLTEEEIKKIAQDRLKPYLEHQEIIKVIYVPHKLCNFVVKSNKITS